MPSTALRSWQPSESPAQAGATPPTGRLLWGPVWTALVSPRRYVLYCLLITALIGTVRALVTPCAWLILRQGSHHVVKRKPVVQVALPMVF